MSAIIYRIHGKATTPGPPIQQSIASLLGELQSRPEDARLHRLLAIAYKDLGETNKALDHAIEAVSLAPLDYESHFVAGQCFLDLEQPADAELPLRAAFHEAVSQSHKDFILVERAIVLAECFLRNAEQTESPSRKEIRQKEAQALMTDISEITLDETDRTLVQRHLDSLNALIETLPESVISKFPVLNFGA